MKIIFIKYIQVNYFILFSHQRAPIKNPIREFLSYESSLAIRTDKTSYPGMAFDSGCRFSRRKYGEDGFRQDGDGRIGVDLQAKRKNKKKTCHNFQSQNSHSSSTFFFSHLCPLFHDPKAILKFHQGQNIDSVCYCEIFSSFFIHEDFMFDC